MPEGGTLPNLFYKVSIILIPKPNKTLLKKRQRELQVNIPDEHRCKNPQQNIRKPNSIIH